MKEFLSDKNYVSQKSFNKYWKKTLPVKVNSNYVVTCNICNNTLSKEKKIYRKDDTYKARKTMKGYQIALTFDLQKVRVTSPHFVDRECWET